MAILRLDKGSPRVLEGERPLGVWPLVVELAFEAG